MTRRSRGSHALPGAALLIATTLTAGAADATDAVPPPEPIHRETLANGARLVHQQRAGSGTFALSIAALGGSAEDPASKHGLTPLLARMLLRGSERRTAAEVALAVESTGSNVSAAGSSWGVTVSASGPAGAFPKVFEVLAEAVLHPRLDAADLAKEVALARQSHRARLDDPSTTLWRTARPLLFGVHPFGRIADPESHLDGIDADALHAAYAERFVGRRLVVVVVGGVDRDAAVGAIRSAFGQRREGRAARLPFDPPAPLAEELRARAKRRTSQAEILFALPTPGIPDDDGPAMDLLAHILGGFQERLSTEIREKRGWAYWLRAVDWRAPGAGLFGVHTAVPKKHLSETERIVRAGLERIASRPPSAEETDRARRFLMTARARTWQTSSGRAAAFLRSLAHGAAPRTLDEQAARYEAVTPAEITTLARRLLDSSRPAVITLH